jgi:hypothetical protein
MSTFSAKGSDIDVEAIMANVRKRVDEKRKGLYTEEEVREIAEMRLDAVLDANEFNSDFVAAFRARDEKWNYSFDPETIYASSRSGGGGGGLIRTARRLLNPILKLLFNPNPLISALSRQSDLNRYYVLLLHNMAQELTRTNLELTNLKARLRTLGIRVDFQAKREKTLEGMTVSRDRRSEREMGRDRDRDRGRDREASGGSSQAGRGESAEAGQRRRQRGGRRNYRRRRGGKPDGSGRPDSRDSGGSGGGRGARGGAGNGGGGGS